MFSVSGTLSHITGMEIYLLSEWMFKGFDFQNQSWEGCGVQLSVPAREWSGNFVLHRFT